MSEQSHVPFDQDASDLSRRDFVDMGLAAGIVATAAPASAALPVVETMVEIKTPDGTCDAAFSHPTNGSHPAVLIWADAFGLRFLAVAIAASADYLVTGEIRPLGEGARASIQVADLHTGREIWSKSFDASAEGVRTETDAYEIGDAAAAQIGAYPGAISIADYKKIQSKPVAELNSYQSSFPRSSEPRLDHRLRVSEHSNARNDLPRTSRAMLSRGPRAPAL